MSKHYVGGTVRFSNDNRRRIVTVGNNFEICHECNRYIPWREMKAHSAKHEEEKAEAEKKRIDEFLEERHPQTVLPRVKLIDLFDPADFE